MTKQAKYISRVLIESPYYVGLCKTNAQFKSELERLGVDKNTWSEWVPSDKDGRVHSLYSKDGKPICLVCIKHKKNISRVSVIGLIIHEAVHIWQHIREDINEESPSKEFEAYSIQQIAQELIIAYYGDF